VRTLNGPRTCAHRRLVGRPNPAWLLSRVAHLVYSEAVNGVYDIPRWPGALMYQQTACQRFHGHTQSLLLPLLESLTSAAYHSGVGTRAELYELQALPQLALIEWRDTCDGLVERDRQGQLSTTAEEFRMAIAQALGATACAGLAVAIVSSTVLGRWPKRSA
jgi:hypothetical protein